MARLARLHVPGLPQLLVQRGSDRQTIFVDDADRDVFLRWLRDAAREQGVAIHAYVLMPDHFHLLATPSGERSVGRMLQSIGRRYVAHFNRRVGRSGTLWAGRYRSTVIDPDSYLVMAMRYIESNPVRANLVADPAGYHWSSCAHHVGIRPDPIVTDHPQYWALANTPFERQAAYRQLLDEPLAPSELAAIRASTHKGWMLAEPKAIARYVAEASRRPSLGVRGRPRSKD